MRSSSGAVSLTRMAVKEKEAERLKKIQFVCDRCGAVLEKTAIKIIPNVVELEGKTSCIRWMKPHMGCTSVQRVRMPS